MRPSDMPDWPRLMDVKLAASYCGISASKFRTGIGSIWPESIRIGRNRRWDRRALDAAIDRLSEDERRNGFPSPGEAIREAREINL